MKKRSKLQAIWFWTKRIFLILFISQFVYIIILKWVNPPITITQFVSWVSGDGLKRDYIDEEEMSPYIRLAVLASEDQKFPDHNGIDWKSIDKAIEHNKRGRSTHGASTISQQVAKNVFLWQKGGYFRKGLELYFTKMIEWIWGKKRILEVYLNVIEMGRGVYGVEAASQTFFKKPAKKLSQHEAALIAACLPNPKVFAVQPFRPYVNTRAAQIQRQMSNLQGDPDVKEVIKK